MISVASLHPSVLQAAALLCVWLEVRKTSKVEWRCFTLGGGAPSVTTNGTTEMQKWSAGSSASGTLRVFHTFTLQQVQVCDVSSSLNLTLYLTRSYVTKFPAPLLRGSEVYSLPEGFTVHFLFWHNPQDQAGTEEETKFSWKPQEKCWRNTVWISVSSSC